ncbi:hypothetical protein KC460_00560 [Candidatus Dependentiae bacterium]|nr:hypothetical protein [Candidatus Dependentiae bacterium]
MVLASVSFGMYNRRFNWFTQPSTKIPFMKRNQIITSSQQALGEHTSSPQIDSDLVINKGNITMRYYYFLGIKKLGCIGLRAPVYCINNLPEVYYYTGIWGMTVTALGTVFIGTGILYTTKSIINYLKTK